MKIWIDTDAGVDDATAILICLNCPDVEIIGISCVDGNASLQNVIRNVNRTLKVWGKTDIPIYAGCSKALIQPSMEIPEIHGKDGLGDIDDKSYGIDTPIMLEKEHAVNALIDACNKYEDLNVLCLAPLTNIACALRMNQEAFLKIKHLYIMGGAEDGVGNTSPYAEFNWRADPEAAHIVLESFPQVRTTIISWTLTVTCSWQPKTFDVCYLEGTEIRRFVKETWNATLTFCKGIFYPADPLAAFVACYGDKAVTKSERLRLSIVLHGEKIGMSPAVPDENGCLVIKGCDREFFLDVLRKLQDHR